MFDEILIQGGPALAQIGPRDRSGFATGFRAGARNMIANPLMRWDTTIIRRIRWTADRSEAVVIATHREMFQIAGEDVPLALKMRWWFVRRGGAWKVYDIEGLDDGLRISVTMAELLRQENLPRLPELRAAMIALKESYTGLLAGDLDAFDEGLARCRQFPFPDKLQASLLALEAAGHMARNKPESALDCIDRAEKLNPDIPLRHSTRLTCRNMLGDHEGALAAADAYFEQLGATGHYLQRGIRSKGWGARTRPRPRTASRSTSGRTSRTPSTGYAACCPTRRRPNSATGSRRPATPRSCSTS